jgi:hypothetical protein
MFKYVYILAFVLVSSYCLEGVVELTDQNFDELVRS